MSNFVLSRRSQGLLSPVPLWNRTVLRDEDQVTTPLPYVSAQACGTFPVSPFILTELPF